MLATDQTFQSFAQGLVPNKIEDPETLRKATIWYKTFTGLHAVPMLARDLVEIYSELH